MYKEFQTTESANTKTGLEKIEAFVRNAIQVLTQDDLSYARKTYMFLFQEDSPMLVGDDRQYFIILNQLVTNGLADGSLTNRYSHEELVQIISTMQTGMITKWQMSHSSENVLAFNELPLKWLFDMISGKPKNTSDC